MFLLSLCLISFVDYLPCYYCTYLFLFFTCLCCFSSTLFTWDFSLKLSSKNHNVLPFLFCCCVCYRVCPSILASVYLFDSMYFQICRLVEEMSNLKFKKNVVKKIKKENCLKIFSFPSISSQLRTLCWGLVLRYSEGWSSSSSTK